MSEKDPKRLDQLFQQGSEQYDFEYKPEAWEEMESLLDKDKRRRRMLWWWWGLLFLLLSVSIWWFLAGRITSPERQVVKERAMPPARQLDAAEPAAGQDLAKAPALDIPSQDAAEVTTTQKKKAVTSNASALTSTGPVKEKKRTTEQGSTYSNLHHSESRDRIAGKEMPTTSQTDRAGDDLLVPSRDSSKGPASGVSVTSMGVVPLPVLPIILLPLENESLLTAHLPVGIFPKMGNLSTSKRKNLLLVGGGLGAETTIVDTQHPTELDWKLGVQLEYFYRQKYSLSLGANYVRKSYLAGEGAYSPPTGFWTRKIAPQSTSGMCKILEVPVLFGYYPQGSSQSGWFGKLGFTSFFMLQEHYYFAYDLPDEDLIRKWYGYDEYWHWFGTGQVTMGYQVRLGARTALQVAPYFQMPLSGLGHGKVRLWSLGVNANFNFQLN